MQGQVYVPVQADASDSFSLFAAGSTGGSLEGDVGRGFTITWKQPGGITGESWLTTGVTESDTDSSVINQKISAALGSGRGAYEKAMTWDDATGRKCVIW